MTMSSRAAIALGLGLAAVLSSSTVSHAQTDAAVRKTNTSATAAAPIPQAKIGAIDVEKVLKDYKKVKTSSEAIRAEVAAKQMQLSKLYQQGQALAKELEALEPESADAREHKNKMKQLQIQLEADKASAQEEFARKESEALSELYKEIQAMAAAVAHAKGLNFIVRISNEPVTASEPNSVMAAMARSIVYADPQVDITDFVIYHLNKNYDAANAGKPAARPAAAAAPAPKAAAAAPRGN
jgi:outer membrane protein